MRIQRIFFEINCRREISFVGKKNKNRKLLLVKKKILKSPGKLCKVVYA